VGDLFVHGLGGARYDEVTDGLITAFYGIPPPPFVVASMTLQLPIPVPSVSDRQIEEGQRRIERLRHNPDDLLQELEGGDGAAPAEAQALAAQKHSLQRDLQAPGANRKTLGLQIRGINERLAQLLAPVAARLGEELSRMRAGREAAEILGDRTYPFCFWSPREIRDRARAPASE
jgi:hypothetical protein